jgi:hypothetical protein
MDLDCLNSDARDLCGFLMTTTTLFLVWDCSERRRLVLCIDGFVALGNWCHCVVSFPMMRVFDCG